FQRNMRIDVAAPDENGCASESPGIFARGPRRTDETSAEPDDRPVLCCVPCGVLKPETRALREAHDRDPSGGNVDRQITDYAAQCFECRRKIRFVFLERRKKRER